MFPSLFGCEEKIPYNMGIVQCFEGPSTIMYIESKMNVEMKTLRHMFQNPDGLCNSVFFIIIFLTAVLLHFFATALKRGVVGWGLGRGGLGVNLCQFCWSFISVLLLKIKEVYWERPPV